MMALGGLGFALMLSASPPGVSAGAVIAGGLGWRWTDLFSLAVLGQNPDSPAAAMGIAAAGLFAAVLGPLAAGRLIEDVPPSAAWAACASLCLLALLAVTAARRIVPTRRPTSATSLRST
jgi:hypothetical protein